MGPGRNKEYAVTTQSRIEAILLPLGIEVGLAATHLQSGASVAINAAALWPTASVFKVPVMVEVYRQAREGRFALSDRMAMPDAQRTIGSGVMQKLAPGLAPTIRDLIMLMTIISDNTATQMLLDLVGAAQVTATMRRLGLHDIHVVLSLPQLFAHVYHLPLAPLPDYDTMQEAMRTSPMDYASLAFAMTAGNTTSSAADMAALMALILQHEAGNAADCADMLAILGSQQLRDRVPRYLPPAATANKTGTFKGIRNDAGIIRRGPDDTISFALFTFDRTPLPVDDYRLLADRNALVNNAMAETGLILWDWLGREG
jgi:beta-lactamase class A